jgi:hypothetical protein
VKDLRFVDESFTYGDLKKLSDKQLAKLVKHATTHVTPLPGDLLKHTKNLRDFTLNYETASHFTTTSDNDLHRPDIHRSEILNYASTEPYPNITERAKMVYDNPATIASYFFATQLIRRDVLSRSSYPVSFTKWFVSKFEFQGRGTVHEHTLKKLVYL